MLAMWVPQFKQGVSLQQLRCVVVNLHSLGSLPDLVLDAGIGDLPCGPPASSVRGVRDPLVFRSGRLEFRAPHRQNPRYPQPADGSCRPVPEWLDRAADNGDSCRLAGLVVGNLVLHLPLAAVPLTEGDRTPPRDGRRPSAPRRRGSDQFLYLTTSPSMVYVLEAICPAARVKREPKADKPVSSCKVPVTVSDKPTDIIAVGMR